jgi:hypothetical protein
VQDSGTRLAIPLARFQPKPLSAAKSKTEGFMKLMMTLLGALTIASTGFAAESQEYKCEDVVKKAATVFELEIVGEMSNVADIYVMSQNKTAAGYETYVEASNANGTRIRDSVVKTDDYCNVKSVGRED